jgi:hypothetical protein
LVLSGLVTAVLSVLVFGVGSSLVDQRLEISGSWGFGALLLLVALTVVLDRTSGRAVEGEITKRERDLVGYVAEAMGCSLSIQLIMEALVKPMFQRSTECASVQWLRQIGQCVRDRESAAQAGGPNARYRR